MVIPSHYTYTYYIRQNIPLSCITLNFNAQTTFQFQTKEKDSDSEE